MLEKFRFLKISKNFDLVKFFEKYKFGQNFRKNFVQISEKISIFVKIFENFDFEVKFSKNFDFGQILPNISIFGQNFRKSRKMSILVKCSTIFDFCQNLRTKFQF